MLSGIRLGAKQTLAVGFIVIILIGTLLLMLPISNKSGDSIHFLDALFTATSATCVTGLVVFDTWSQFTFFGQLIILILIQTGGLGFMTIAILFSMVLGKRIGLRERSFLMEAINSMQISGVVRLVKHILIGTLMFEALGAVLLSSRFYGEFGLWESIWFGIFHSVSAFCNAGFDLMGRIEPYTSLVPFQSDILVNLTVMALIVIGGIGFVVWDDLFRNKLDHKNYSLHTKIVLLSTAALITVSTVVFFMLESEASMKGMDYGERLLASFFQSITPRTAGFNTIDTAALSEAGSLYTMFLMIIGASPGSTAGGIKITTFVIIGLSLITYFRRFEDVNIFNRRLDPSIVRRAYFSATFYLFLMLAGTFIIVSSQNMLIEDALFEASSAIGTVGLTKGVTQGLSEISKLVIIALMYSGRLGSLTVFMAVTEKRCIRKLRNPEDKIIIG